MYTLTITADSGPAIQNTAEVITNVTKIEFDMVGGVLTIYVLNAQSPRTFDISALTTVTTVPAAKTMTVVA